MVDITANTLHTSLGFRLGVIENPVGSFDTSKYVSNEENRETGSCYLMNRIRKIIYLIIHFTTHLVDILFTYVLLAPNRQMTCSYANNRLN